MGVTKFIGVRNIAIGRLQDRLIDTYMARISTPCLN